MSESVTDSRVYARPVGTRKQSGGGRDSGLRKNLNFQKSGEMLPTENQNLVYARSVGAQKS
jgi:hypothetical protein